MLYRDLFAVIMRVIGLIALVYLIELSFTAYSYLMNYVELNSSIGKSFLGVLVYIIVTPLVFAYILYLLIFRTFYLIDYFRIDKGFSNEKISSNVDLLALTRLALLIIGLTFFFYHLPMFLKYLYYFFTTKLGVGELQEYSLQFFYKEIFYIVIGIVLVIYNKTISVIITKNIKSDS